MRQEIGKLLLTMFPGLDFQIISNTRLGCFDVNYRPTPAYLPTAIEAAVVARFQNEHDLLTNWATEPGTASNTLHLWFPRHKMK